MDAQQFDAFVRSFSTTTRRGSLAGLLGAVAAAAFGLPDEAATKKRRRKKRRRKRRRRRKNRRAAQCSGGACANHFATKQDRDHCEFICRQCDGDDPRAFCIVEGDPSDPAKVAACCIEGAACCGGHGGVCCGGDPGLPGVHCCDGDCVNTQSNEQHCGACDAPCAEDQSCVDGACVGDGGGGGGSECRSQVPSACDFGLPCWPAADPHMCCDNFVCIGYHPADSDCCGRGREGTCIPKTQFCIFQDRYPPHAWYIPGP